MKLGGMVGEALSLGVPSAIGIWVGFKGAEWFKQLLPQGGILVAPISGLVLGSIIMAVGKAPSVKVLAASVFGASLFVAIRESGLIT